MKTEATRTLEQSIYLETRYRDMMGCFEVTIGYYGSQRVDYLTYDYKGIWRCYEIKTSLSDFHSKAAITFVGHLNYYVLTSELYEKVKCEIPDDIGVYVGRKLIKRPKRRALGIDEKVLFNSMIRSLNREFNRMMDNGNEDVVGRYRREIERLRKENQGLRHRVFDYQLQIRNIERRPNHEQI